MTFSHMSDGPSMYSKIYIVYIYRVLLQPLTCLNDLH